jgi:hypothetical protein
MSWILWAIASLMFAALLAVIVDVARFYRDKA